jgi:hypothetical protein
VNVLSISALLLSLLALAVSTRLTIKQQAIQRHANTLPALAMLLAEFRSADFHESYEYVCARLEEHPADCGISGLPPEARRHGWLEPAADARRRRVVPRHAEILGAVRLRVVGEPGDGRPWRASAR